MIYEAVNAPVLELCPPTARTILDVGCGSGALGAALKRRRTSTVVGITSCAAEAVIARARIDDVLVQDLDQGRLLSVPYRFDCIICSHVLEHLARPSDLLRGLASCLAPGGALIVALPNALHWRQRAAFARGSFAYTEGGVMDDTHLRFFDWHTAQCLLTDSGYEIAHAEAMGSLPLPGIRRVLPRRVADMADSMASAAFPGLFGVQFLFLAHPRL